MGSSAAAAGAWAEGAPLLEQNDPALFKKARRELIDTCKEAGIDSAAVLPP
jgi:hypothetical protein